MSSAIKTLLLAHHTDDHSVTGQAIARFATRVAERSGGLLNIADLPCSTLGNIPALLRRVIAGEADMAFAPYDRLCDLIPKFGCAGLPYVFDDLAHADRVLNGPFADWALPDLFQRGLHSLASWEWGFRQLTNNRHPILQPGDVRGLRIRVPPILLNQEAMRALGAIPVVVEFAQLGTVIRQGMVDGQENPVAIIHDHQLYTSQPHMSLLDYSYGAMLHLINRKTYEALSAEHQHILNEESRLAGQQMRQALRSQEAEQIAQLRSLGMHIERPDPAPFRAAMHAAHAPLAAAFGPARVNTFMAMVEHLRQPPQEQA